MEVETLATCGGTAVEEVIATTAAHMEDAVTMTTARTTVAIVMATVGDIDPWKSSLPHRTRRVYFAFSLHFSFSIRIRLSFHVS